MNPAFTSESRRDNLRRLRADRFDVLVLGGGINGAGVARDLALRARNVGWPLRIALVEQRHFASGTSGKNSQLIHGGLRYLKQLEFGLVREALRERATLVRIAPHLVEPQPFLIPLYGWFARAFYGTGLWLYDLLAGGDNIGRRRYLSLDEVARMEPHLARKGLTSAAIFLDCRIHSARFVLENIFDAARDGVVVANYTRAGSFSRDGGSFCVNVVDALTGDTFETRARKLVDATGPWENVGSLRLVRGSHLVLPRINASRNAIAHFGQDGRIVFVIPWGSRGQLSLVGTTDVDHAGGPDDVCISGEEVRYLLDVVHGLFPSARDLQPITAYSSLRPLLQSDSASATQTSREHRIWNSPDGVLHVAGGKYTTYRVMSAEAADAVCREVAPGLVSRCMTSETPLGGNTRERLEGLLAQATSLAARHNLEACDVSALIHDYGVLTPCVLGYLPETAQAPLTRLQCAAARFALNHELAQRLADLLFVSTYWGYEQPPDERQFRAYAAQFGRCLEWNQQRIEEEVRLALRLIAVPA